MTGVANLKDIKYAYENARKKYNLPPFDKVDSVFEIRRAEQPAFILRDLRRTIIRMCQTGANDLLPILNPHPNDLHSLIEAGAFTKAEKTEIMNLYKKFMYYMHQGIVVALGTDKECANFINKFWKDWPALKRAYKKILVRTTQEWKKNSKASKEDFGYVG